MTSISMKRNRVCTASTPESATLELSANRLPVDSLMSSKEEYPDAKYLRSRGRRLNKTNNKRVVSHLRRRLRQRLLDTITDECSLNDGETNDDKTKDGIKEPSQFVDTVNVFSKYNDIGGRVSREGQVSNGLHPDGSIHSLSNIKSSRPLNDACETSLSYSDHGSSKSPIIPENHKSSTDNTKGISDRTSAVSILNSTEILKVSNVMVTNEKITKDSTANSEQGGIQLAVSGQSRCLSATGSASSLPLENSSSPLLPKIDSPICLSRRHSTPHTTLSPDFKLPVIRNGCSLVNPDYSPNKSTLVKKESIADQKSSDSSDKSRDLNQLKDHLSSHSTEGIDTSDHNSDPSSQPTDRCGQIFVDDVDEVKDVYGSNMEQPESKGFEFDECVSPVLTPQPIDEFQVVEKKSSLTTSSRQVYQGCIDTDWPIPTRIVRVYISSTFLDFEAERTALVAKCYPKLRSLCRQRGYEFQVCDMRWGLYDIVMDNHSFTRLCLQQLKSCQTVSAAVNFVSFLGHRYGGQILPSSIPVAVFEAVLAILCKEKDKLIERRTRLQSTVIGESALGGESSEAKRRISVLSGISELQLGTVDETMSMEKTTGPSTNRHKTLEVKKTHVGKEAQVDNTAELSEDEGSETESEKMMDEKQVEKEFDANISALKTWFKLNENAMPPVYQLQNISCQYRDILSNDKVKKIRARNQWLIVQKRLQKIFNKYLSKALTSHGQYINDFFLSMTVQEIQQGILSASGDLHDKALSFRRQITDLKSNLHDYAAKNYIDLHNLRPEIDASLVQKVEDMKKEKIPTKLSYTNIFDLSVAWFKEGINPTTTRPHALYIARLTNEFSDVMKNKIKKCLNARGDANAVSSNNLCEEVAQHLNLVRERCKTFYGCKEVLGHIKQYLLSDSNQALVLHGPTGCGKTSILAKTADLLRQWLKSIVEKDFVTLPEDLEQFSCELNEKRSSTLGHRDDITMVIRFIGHTPGTLNIRTLIRHLSQQVSHVYDLDASTVPQDYFGVLNDFGSRLSVASSEKPLVVILDGLDRLSSKNSAHNIKTWMPRQLPENVHIILSMSDCESLKAIKKLLGAGNNLLAVPSLSAVESQTILDNTLRHAGRTISLAQRDVVIAGVEENPIPLYVILAAQEALLWQSFSVGRQLFLPKNLKKLISAVFLRLEASHTEPLVRRALGYITAAQNGITWTELEDLLSLDDAVMSDVVLHHGTSVRRLPPALWCRLKNDLELYLSVSLVDNMQTYRWQHRLFHEVSTERYLLQRDKAISYHTAFADYFLGKWVNVKKPFHGNQTGADRLVDDQPLMWTTADEHVIYNLRKLNELPYHLIQSNQLDVLKSQTLFNYEFMLTKLKAQSLYSILDDLQRALFVQPNDVELCLLSDTLHLSADGLTKDPNQLATQLIGRLQNMIANDRPLVIGESKKYPMLSMMVSQSNRSSVPTLIPSKTCLAPPGGVLNDLLAGHTKAITAVAADNSGVTAATASLDGTIKLWDLCNRKVIKTIQAETLTITSICFYARNLYLATINAVNDIYIWNIRKGSRILTIDQYIDPPIISTAGEDSQYLVAFFSGSNVMRTWQIGYECSMIKEFAIISRPGIHKDNSICVSPRANGYKVLYAFRSDNRAYVSDATTGQRIHELVIPGEAASITSLSMSHDYYILACRYQYMKLSEIHHLELFDIKHGTYLRSIRGCTQDSVNELYVNKLGSHAVCLSPSVKCNTTHIAVWNLETDDHKHLAKHPQISSMGACTDLNYCISASKQDKVLRIWNLSKKVNERQSAHKKGPAKTRSMKSEGIVQIVPMKNNPRYVVAKSVNNGPVTVWNVVKGKCATSPVRIERGLIDSHDIVLVRNHYVVVLSDRGMLSVSDRLLQVFQTVYVYNLKTKKYIRKLTGVFIIPSPAHEYHLLDGELLLGLSESRDHLIVWSLETGHMKYRIKNSFKELWRGLTKEEEELRMRPKRNTTAKMPAWDRRSETMTARLRRRENEVDKEKKRLDSLNMEKENTIEQYMMSQDENVIVCSYFAHHLCVFDMATQKHTHTLENQNSMLHLYNVAMTPTGSHLVHVNYDDYEKYSYVTLWDLGSGTIKKRIRNEPNVCCIGINSSATRVFFGNERNILKIWDVQGVVSTLRKLKGYPGMQLCMDSKIFMIQNGVRALVFANDISIWDLDSAARLAMFSPDIRVTDIHVVTDSQLIILALRDNADVVTLRLKGRGIEVDPMDNTEGEELFGETTGDSTDEEDEEEDEIQEGKKTVKSDAANN